MKKEGFTIYELENHPTKDISDLHINGDLTVIWRNWDKIISNPEMIYVNSVNPGEIKGPHIHKNRTSYFYCIHGRMVIIIQDKDGKYHEIETDDKTPKLVSISNGIAAAIVNPSESISKILVLADIAWKPDDSEMANISFNDYDWKKWNVNNN